MTMTGDGEQDTARGGGLRMWVAVRTDLAMPRGKLAVQAGHGFATAILKAHARDPALVDAYQADSMAKVAVGVRSVAELEWVAREAGVAGIDHCLVVDEGRTVFAEPTATVCAFGPCTREALPPFLRRLRLLSDPEGAEGQRVEGGVS